MDQSARLPALLAALVVAGCASYGAGLQPGVSSQAQVEATMGKPAEAFELAGGTRRLAYTYGQLSTQTLMADIGPDGKLARLTQVLDDDVFRRIQPGWTRDEVRRAIGPPADTSAFPRSGRDAWNYRYTDTWGYLAVFSVSFDGSGRVVEKTSQRVDRDKSR